MRAAPRDDVRLTIDDRGRPAVAPVRTVPDIAAFIGVWKSHTPYATGQELVEDLRGPADP